MYLSKTQKFHPKTFIIGCIFSNVYSTSYGTSSDIKLNENKKREREGKIKSTNKKMLWQPAPVLHIDWPQTITVAKCFPIKTEPGAESRRDVFITITTPPHAMHVTETLLVHFFCTDVHHGFDKIGILQTDLYANKAVNPN